MKSGVSRMTQAIHPPIRSRCGRGWFLHVARSTALADGHSCHCLFPFPPCRLHIFPVSGRTAAMSEGCCLYDRASFPTAIHLRRHCAMQKLSTTPSWTRHLFYRAEHIRTTWKLRLGLLTLVVALLWLTNGWWTAAIARSLVCDASLAPSDAILVENFDPDYLLFERATQLRQAGFAQRVLVPTSTDPGTSEVNAVALGTVEVMARLSRIGPIETVPVREAEPITLNAARDLQHFLEREHIRSVIVVTSLFRSRRSALVHAATLGRAGIAVRCQPVQGVRAPDTWTRSWHGIQNVVEQWFKLQYYRLYVLPFRLNPD